MNPEARTDKNEENNDEGDKEKYLTLLKKRYRQQSTNSRKAKQVTNNGNRAEDIKTCDGTTKDMIRQIFNEVSRTTSPIICFT